MREVEYRDIVPSDGLGFWAQALTALASTAISVGGSFATSAINTSAMKKQIAAQTSAQTALLREQEASSLRLRAAEAAGAVGSAVSSVPVWVYAAGGVAVLAFFMMKRKR